MIASFARAAPASRMVAPTYPVPAAACFASVSGSSVFMTVTMMPCATASSMSGAERLVAGMAHDRDAIGLTSRRPR